MTVFILLVLFFGSLLVYSARAAAWAGATWPPSGKFIELDGEFEGLRLHYLVCGERREGVAPVVLIHGASGNLRDMVEGLAGPLSRETLVVAFDRPGHGWSERGNHPDIADPAMQARAIAQAAAKLGVEKPVVVGHSWGASVAAAWALADPQGIAGLLPLSGALYPWPGGIAWYHSVVRTPLIGAVFLRTMIVPGGKVLMPKGVAANFHPDKAPEGYAEAIALPLLFRPSEFRANSEDTANLKGHLARQSMRYGEISVPTIVVTGNADYTVSPKLHSYAFHNAVAGSELIKLRGTGHMPHYARRDAVVDAVLRLARGERPRAGQTTIHEDGRVEMPDAAA